MTNPDIGLEIDFLAVGEESSGGDAITLRYGNLHGPRSEQTVIVIDGGFVDSGEQLVEHSRNHFNTDEVDVVVSTHPDQDHAGGLKVVLEELTNPLPSRRPKGPEDCWPTWLVSRSGARLPTRHVDRTASISIWRNSRATGTRYTPAANRAAPRLQGGLIEQPMGRHVWAHSRSGEDLRGPL